MPSFDSRSEKFRSPFGAVEEGRTVHFVFPVLCEIKTLGVDFCVRSHFDESCEHYAMSFYKQEEGENVFVLDYLPPAAGVFFYRFEIRTSTGVLFVGNNGEGKAIIGDWLPEWQLTVYQKWENDFSDFVGRTVYHAFVDRFCKGKEGRKPCKGVWKEWEEDITIADADGVYRANDFYGGDLEGIIRKIPYLKDLGVSALYLSPIFESSSNHRYDTGDYLKIDPMIGDEETFVRLKRALKEAGIKLILDGVFNHTGADSKYFNKFGHYPTLGAYQSEQSPYFDWYTFYDFPEEYHCWWGVTVVPTVRRDAKGFQDLIAGEGGVIEKWTKLGADAWRLDVADELSTPFLERIAQKAHDLGAPVIGEVWEDASTKSSYGEKRRYLLGKELDGVMNYPFRTAILDFVNDGDGKKCARRIMDIVEHYPLRALQLSMTLIGTHDTVRAINALADLPCPETKEERQKNRITGKDYQKAVQRVKLAAAIQFFLPGLPTVYYGDECGMQGYEDPINRRPFRVECEELLTFYRSLGKLRADWKENFSQPFFVSGENNRLTLSYGKRKIRFDRNREKIFEEE